MWSSLCITPALVLAVSAQNTRYSSSGPLLPGEVKSPQGQTFEAAAGRHPAASSSVTFPRNSSSSSPETWSWRVNVTEFAVPNNIFDLGMTSANFSEDFHVVNTQWQLGWPDMFDTLQAYLTDRDLTLSVYANVIMNTTGRPSNDTRAVNGSCSSILGKQCAQDLEQAAIDAQMVSQLSLPKTCYEVLAVGQDNFGGSAGFEIGPNTAAASQSALLPNGTLFYSTTPSFKRDNGTRLQAAKSAIQLLILNLKSNSNQSVVETYRPSVVCQVVEGDMSPPIAYVSSASSWQRLASMTVGVALLSFIFVSL